MTNEHQTVAFIGAGNMSGAIIAGLVSNGYPASNIIAANPSMPKLETLQNNLGINITTDNIQACQHADVVVLAVKPHLIQQVCQQLADSTDLSGKCFISVAAGVNIIPMQAALGFAAPVIRCMPNTPSQIGLGVSGMYASGEVSENQRQFADQLMQSVGIVQWLDSEAQIDDLIAVAGSAPAYFFAFMEAMQNKAMALGFSKADSRKLVQQTALGAAHMVVENDDLDISTLRENVTSKGGTTQQALTTFAQGGLAELVDKAMQSAIDRAVEMAKDNS
ncbi:pyrroline-5-carboxylate reductase [Thalassotalea mangrovi]|uniref:Pyrroline-5-carboxylate reductase n=1 Tax=Thalassotalea mangrovi TaxID=2572245 RepID=A0A4U1B9H8_9GAMM|nr:pyrroline-5-carboxylate reductase [Thalassotalea mangrovi]TKB47122.1 pyrroline-5-carboxylate reductase [Thalassotalea mangrovi]